jgi:hypothetical protein
VRRAAVAALLLLAGPAMAEEVVLPQPAVRPPPRFQSVPPSPGPSYEWAKGYWKWNGHAWVWVRGRFVQRRPWTCRWIKGHREGSGGLERWVPGYLGEPGHTPPKQR